MSFPSKFRGHGGPSGFRSAGAYVPPPINSFGLTSGVVTGGFPGNSDRALCTLFNLPENASNLISIVVTMHSSSTSPSNIKAFIASHSGGLPVSILHITGSQLSPAGGGEFTFGLSGSLSSGNYYLGAVTEDFDNNIAQTDPASYDTQMANGTFSFTSPPSTWPGTDANYEIGLDIVVYYNP